MAAILNFQVDKGADWSWAFSETTSNNIPKDFTGYRMRMEVRSAAGGTLYAAFDSDTGAGAEGTITIDTCGTIIRGFLDYAHVTAIPVNTAVHDLISVAPDDTRKREWQGTVVFSPAVTVVP